MTGTEVDGAAARRTLLAGRGIEPDRFQLEAFDHLDAGDTVLVAAPTSSGKTLVAEYGIQLALARGQRAFYTAPIKALSNQKLVELGELFGREQVGLLTGDNVIRPDAPVVVMTTEVLRNMIYAGSPALDDLGLVVLDEIHYLMDPYRGPVWEEVIVQLDQGVQLVCLSATVSNGAEIAGWLDAVRGGAEVVVETTRPVALRNRLLLGDKATGRLRLEDTLDERGRPARATARLLERAEHQPGGRRRGSRWFSPRRPEVVEQLAEAGLLPAIYFVFSRNGCDEAARAVGQTGVRLTDGSTTDRVAAIVERRLAGLDAVTREALEVDRWHRLLERGIAAHHAGLVPAMKEAVEECFAEGLLGVVFATETLAMGVNLPARSVVIESLSKYRGDGHSTLTPGEYTQLTGRAGRRGIDRRGDAVVCWNRFLRFDDLARLASSGDFELTSAFRPTYNMVANLVATQDREGARSVLGQSLAQFQTDRLVVGLRGRRERIADELADVRAVLDDELGERLGPVLDAARADGGDRRRRPAPDDHERALIDEALAALRPGAVLVGPSGWPAAVLSTSTRRSGETLVRTVDARGRVHQLRAGDLRTAPEPIGQIELPRPYTPGKKGFQQEVGRRLDRDQAARAAAEARGGSGPDAPAAPVRRQVRRLVRLERDLEALDRRIGRSGGDLVRRFDVIEEELRRRDFLDGWRLTSAGETLAGLYHESDLLLAEALRARCFDDLDAAELAALTSCLVYEHRSPDPPPPPWFPSAEVARRYDTIEQLAAKLNRFEQHHDLPETRPPDAGFVPIAHGWMLDLELGDVLDDRQVSPGDFVRTARQLIDLLRQLGQVTAGPLAATARDAARDLDRGLVAATRLDDADDGEDEPAPESA
ncbi:MAG: DEAD/DEAH box helicase [Actinomycetota bacterium]